MPVCPIALEWNKTWSKSKYSSLFAPVFINVSSFSFSSHFTQEAYSVARQFNLIPPVCEQAEYHFFQREKVETQLPELYHKIGQIIVCLFWSQV